MKMRFFILGGLIFAAAQSFGSTLVYMGVFSGLQEFPPNASPGTGIAIVTIDDVLKSMRTEAAFSGLIGNTLAAHIHIGNGPGTNGGVASQTPSFTGFPLGVTSGSYDHTFDMLQASSWNASYITANGGTPGSAFTAFLNKLAHGNGYFNLHTSAFAGGEVRADLTLVPEPATMTLLGLGVAAIAARRRVRK
jgi:hypothetical protein